MGRIWYLNEVCKNNESGFCNQGRNCQYCHSELEYLYHPMQYKTQMWEQGPHPFQEFWPHAHCQIEIRDVEGYRHWLKIPIQHFTKSTSQVDTQESEYQSLDKVNNLPPKVSLNKKSRKIKKSVSMNCSGLEGIEATFSSKGNKLTIKKKSKNTKPAKAKEAHTLYFLDLKTFKVNPCTAGSNHNPKKCLNYHDSRKDRRRPIGTYSSEICNHVSKGGKWRYGNNCKRSHNRVEEFYHPEKYKVKFCSKYPDSLDTWEYGQFWSFAHHTEELKIDLIDKMEKDEDFYLFHFKTVWCPYTENKHARDEWVYAHNWQDFRRKPQLFPYSHEQCPKWHQKSFIKVYGDGCRNEFLCPYSHGWKEQEYHPNNYKKNACKNGTSCTKHHCPYFHTDTEKKDQIPDGFRLMPKNRGSVFRTNEYLAEYIQNQAPLVLPYRSKIYHPSTAPFVNSDVFMKQPYYIIHASLGFKDQPVYSNYLAGHAKDQQFHKQKKSGKESKEKIPRTLSYNSHMNAEASLAFYPTNNKVSPKPVLGQIGSYSDNNKRFPMSASHGRLVNLGEKFRNFNVSSPTIENSVPSRTNFIREDKEEERETWDNKIYQQEPDFLLPKFMHWQSNDGQMIPSALKAQFSLKKTMSMKDCTASDFHSHFENKLSNGTKTKEKSEIFESNTDLAKWNENHNFIDAKSGPINVLKNPTLH